MPALGVSLCTQCHRDLLRFWLSCRLGLVSPRPDAGSCGVLAKKNAKLHPCKSPSTTERSVALPFALFVLARNGRALPMCDPLCFRFRSFLSSCVCYPLARLPAPVNCARLSCRTCSCPPGQKRISAICRLHSWSSPCSWQAVFLASLALPLRKRRT